MVISVRTRCGLEPVTQDFPHLDEDIFVSGFNCKVDRFASVIFHVIELLAIEAFVIKYVFVAWSTYHPAESSGGLLEIGFGNDIFLGGCKLLCCVAPADSLSAVRKLSSGEIAYRRHKVNSSVDKRIIYLTCIFPVREAYDHRNIRNFFI